MKKTNKKTKKQKVLSLKMHTVLKKIAQFFCFILGICAPLLFTFLVIAAFKVQSPKIPVLFFSALIIVLGTVFSLKHAKIKKYGLSFVLGTIFLYPLLYIISFFIN